MQVQPTTFTNGAADEAEIARVFRVQQENLPRLRATTARARIDKLNRLYDALFERRQAIRDAVFADFRKPPEEVDLTEIGTVAIEIRHATKHLKRWMRPKNVGTPLTLFGTKSEIRYEPKGTALIIAPWNYPVDLALSPLVGALAAGCSAILKPSEAAPHTTRLLKTMLAELFDESEVAVFEGDKTVAQALLKLPFDHIYFTGSPAVGKIVMRAAAGHLTSVTLELGGKSPTIVDASADVEQAARAVAWGKFTNAGQTCIAPDYVLAHTTIHDAFVAALRRHLDEFYGDDAASSGDYARLIHAAHFERVRGLKDDAVAHGARVAYGGDARAAEQYLAPTVLTDVPEETDIMEEEIFGPVLPVLRFAQLDDALATINAKPKPLALYIFSDDDDAVERILGETSAGGTCVNDTLLHFMHPRLPFGGINHSGIGQAHGHFTFLAFSNQRAVLRQKLGRFSPLRKFHPPYTGTTRRLIDLLLKYL